MSHIKAVGRAPVSAMLGTRFRWLMHGGASIIDQGLFSGAQFALNIMLARWLNPAEYGRFAIAYTFVVLINAIHLSFVAEPTAIFWSKQRESSTSVLNDFATWNLLFSLIVAASVSMIGLLLMFLNLVSWVEVCLAGVLSVLLPMFWFYRFVSYSEGRPWRAVTHVLFNSIVLVAGAVWLHSIDALTVTATFLLMGVGALISVLWSVRAYNKFDLRAERRSPASLFSDCWNYGRWSALSAIFVWASNNILLIIMPLTTTIEDSARLKAFLNILLPVQQVLLGLSLVMLPVLSRAFQAKDDVLIRKLSLGFFTIGIGGAVAYSIILFVFGDAIYRFVYGTNYESDVAVLLVGLGLPIVWAIIAVARTVLRSRQDARSIFIAYFVSMASIGLIGFPLGALNGLGGALWAMTAVQGSVAVILVWLVRKGRFGHEVQF